MIELRNVSKYFPTRLGPHYVFRDVSMVLPSDVNIGVIGPNGAGKSTFLRLIAGVDPPSAGEILRDGRISWSMGLAGGLQPSLTGRENARFACRVYGMHPDRIKAKLEKIQDISGIGKHFDLPTLSYSSGMKQRVSFAITIAMEFDYYIFDEIGAGGDLAFAAMAQAMIRDKLAYSRFILASHNLGEIRKLCQSSIVIRNGTVTFFDRTEDAIKAYQNAPMGAAPTTGEALLKIERLKQQFINLKINEQRQELAVKRSSKPEVREAAEFRLQNVRDHLLATSLELRSLGAAPPADAEWLPYAEELNAAKPRSPLETEIFNLKRRIAQLRIDETRQDLNAGKADSRAKKADFLGRLKVTRQKLDEALKDLAILESRLPAANIPATGPGLKAVPADNHR